jgi:hypothetical protein
MTTATSQDVAVSFCVECHRRGRWLGMAQPDQPMPALRSAFLEIDEGLHDFFLRIHHERTVARDRFA